MKLLLSALLISISFSAQAVEIGTFDNGNKTYISCLVYSLGTETAPVEKKKVLNKQQEGSLIYFAGSINPTSGHTLKVLVDEDNFSLQVSQEGTDGVLAMVPGNVLTMIVGETKSVCEVASSIRQ